MRLSAKFPSLFLPRLEGGLNLQAFACRPRIKIPYPRMEIVFGSAWLVPLTLNTYDLVRKVGLSMEYGNVKIFLGLLCSTHAMFWFMEPVLCSAYVVSHKH